jgi:hypothetical protein
MNSGRQPPNGDSGRPKFTAFGLIELGTLNAVSLLLGFGIGWFVDSRLETLPIFMFLGLLVGIGSGVYATYRRIRKYL